MLSNDNRIDGCDPRSERYGRIEAKDLVAERAEIGEARDVWRRDRIDIWGPDSSYYLRAKTYLGIWVLAHKIDGPGKG